MSRMSMGAAMKKTTRKIVHIDEEKCDGCGLCVPSCAEGAIKIVDGKAKLLADNLCDGLGACLGECPRGAITVTERAADAFDEAAAARNALSSRAVPSPLGPGEGTERASASSRAVPSPLGPGEGMHALKRKAAGPHPHGAGGCPGSRMQMHGRPALPPAFQPSAGSRQSQLGHWPVQLTLLPEGGPLWDGTDLLFAADCAPFAMPDFHERLLGGKTLAVACPKLDDCEPYVAKLARIFADNDVRSVTVVRMEVPCCGGLEQIVLQALADSGKKIPAKSILVGVRGEILGERELA